MNNPTPLATKSVFIGKVRLRNKARFDVSKTYLV